MASPTSTDDPIHPVDPARLGARKIDGRDSTGSAAGASKDTAPPFEPQDKYARAQDEVSYATLPKPERSHGPREAFDGIADFLGIAPTKPKAPR